MSRDDGFDVADVSSSLLDDPKVRDLWRRLGDPGRMGHGMTLYLATVLMSWRDGRRVTVTEAAPLYMDADGELVAALIAVKLLDRGGRIPVRSWQGWFGPAWERREKRRRAGMLGGRPPKAPGNHSETSRFTSDNPDRPTGRSVSTVRQDRPLRAPARETASSNDAGRNGRLADLLDPVALAALGKVTA